MRDAALRALLDMYSTSPRCIKRTVLPAAHRRFFTVTSPASRATRTIARHQRQACHVSAAAPTATAPACTSLGARQYATGGGNTGPRSIAVLGGGLTGLTTAWYLTRVLPQARVTLYEASDRLGGWIDTERVEVQTPDGRTGTVNFERAARMVQPQTRRSSTPRWDDLVFFDMVAHLGLAGELEHTVGAAPTTAYVYYPDHLVAMPDSSTGLLALLYGLLTEPVFRDVFPSALHRFLRRNNQYRIQMLQGDTDMSIGDYFAYLTGGTGVVDKRLSAMIHGITGGDVWKLSMANGPLAHTLTPPDPKPFTHAWVRRADYELMRQMIKDKATFDLAEQYLGASAIWFRNGFSTLTDALAEALRKNPNVTIKTGEPVEAVRYDGRSDRVLITTQRQKQPVSYEKVVSTIFAKTLADMTDGHLPSLSQSTAVTIQLVNLWYPIPFANAPYRGFGYLVPQGLDYDRNPECVLGVIFDSDREYSFSSSSNSPHILNRGADTIHGTKLTVMLGGHYWDGLPDSFLPDADAAAALAKAAVARHLGLDPAALNNAQTITSTKLCRHCLPQHLVGHGARMRAAHRELAGSFGGRLAVAGPSYQTPGVLGSVRAARDVAVQIARAAEEEGEGEWGSNLSVGETGLARFLPPGRGGAAGQSFMSVARMLLPLRYKSGAFMGEDGVIRPYAMRPDRQRERGGRK
ncbi:hypothetical protein VTK56DRAFT_4770 [Thermocarpiscus australiensis]